MTTTTLCAKLRLACKCIGLILSIICLGLYVNAPIYNMMGHTGTTPAGTLMTITFGAYIIILLAVIVGYVCEEKVPKKTDLLFVLAGLCLFIASGSVGINHYTHHPDPPKSAASSGSHHDEESHADDLMSYGRTGMACSAIAIVNGLVFLVDAMLSYKDVSETYTPH